jgi:hypothetical protein
LEIHASGLVEFRQFDNSYPADPVARPDSPLKNHGHHR